MATTLTLAMALVLIAAASIGTSVFGDYTPYPV